MSEAVLNFFLKGTYSTVQLLFRGGGPAPVPIDQNSLLDLLH